MKRLMLLGTAVAVGLALSAAPTLAQRKITLNVITAGDQNMVDYVKDYLGPQFEKDHPDVTVEVGTTTVQARARVADPGERAPFEDGELSAAADECWDLDALDRRVRQSQERRWLVADALRIGTITPWDIPGGYISTGDDFWTTIERARRS